MKLRWTFQRLAPIMGIALNFGLLSPAAEAAIPVGASSYFWQNPLPQGNTLNAVSCPTTTSCFAVGDLGTILATANTGSPTPTWVVNYAPATQNLRAISCTSASFCVAVGDNATVLTYSSPHWSLNTQTGIPPALSLRGVSCPSTSACFAVGGNTLFESTNGGVSWTAKHTGVAADSYTSVNCPSSTNCFFVGPTTAGSSAGNILEYGFLFGLFQTIEITTPDPNPLTSISCAATCVAVDGKGNAVTGSPGGGFSLVQVSQPNLGLSVPLNSVSCVPTTTVCYAVGDSSSVFGTINPGGTWFSVQTGVKFVPLLGVSCTSPTSATCYAVGQYGGIATDAPGFWTAEESSVTTFVRTRVSCPVEGTCFAVGTGGTILKTTNFGSTWTPQSSGTSQGLSDISCPSTSVCVAVGPSGTIVAYNGTNWSTQTSGTTQILGAVSCPNTSTCFAAGTSLFMTNNIAGGVWSNVGALAVSVGSMTSSGGMSCTSTTPNTGHCVVAGTGTFSSVVQGAALLTSTGIAGNGVTLIGYVLTGGPALSDVSCQTLAHCVAVGNSGLILSNISGQWAVTLQPNSLVSNNLYGVSCLPSPTGVICEVAGDGPGTPIILSAALTSTSSSFVVEGRLDLSLRGVSCAGSDLVSPPAYQCVAVGNVGTIIAKTVGNTGTGILTPSNGSSGVGQPVTFTLSWIVPSPQSWRNLQYVDLQLIDKDGIIGLWARFIGGTQPEFALLDSSGNIVDEGPEGTIGVLESPTATLDLANSSFQGSGPTGPSVTVNFVVSLKAAAAGNAHTPSAAHIYNTEISAANAQGVSQAPQQVGTWAVRAARF